MAQSLPYAALGLKTFEDRIRRCLRAGNNCYRHLCPPSQHKTNQNFIVIRAWACHCAFSQCCGEKSQSFLLLDQLFLPSPLSSSCAGACIRVVVLCTRWGIHSDFELTFFATLLLSQISFSSLDKKIKLLQGCVSASDIVFFLSTLFREAGQVKVDVLLLFLAEL